MPSFEEPAGEGCQLVWAFASLSSTRFPCTPCQATLQEQPPPLLSQGVGALTGAGLGLQDLQQEDDDGQQVGDVPQDAEDVHGAGGARLG